MDGVAQITDLVHAVVGCAVDLDNIEVTTRGDGKTGRIGRIEVGFGAVGAVQCLGKDTGGGGLACAARADEEIGVGDTAAGDGVAQGADDVILPYDIVKGLGAPFAGDDLIGGG